MLPMFVGFPVTQWGNKKYLQPSDIQRLEFCTLW